MTYEAQIEIQLQKEKKKQKISRGFETKPNVTKHYIRGEVVD